MAVEQRSSRFPSIDCYILVPAFLFYSTIESAVYIFTSHSFLRIETVDMPASLSNADVSDDDVG